MENKSLRNNILIGILVSLVVLIGVFYVWNNNKEEVKPVVSVEEYKVYDYEKVDFRFVVAKLKVESEKDLNIALSNIRVNGIRLDSRSDYIKKLRDNNYLDDFSNIDQVFIVDSENNHVSLFLPILDKEASIATISSDYFDDVVIDLSKNIVLVKDDEGSDENNLPDNSNKDDKVDEIDEVGFKITIEQSISLMDFTYYEDGNEFNSMSGEILYAFPMTLMSKDNDTYAITDAKFVFSESKEEIIAKDGKYKTEFYDNIINQKTVKEVDSYILFTTFDRDFNIDLKEGILYIKVNGSDWFEVEVEVRWKIYLKRL